MAAQASSNTVEVLLFSDDSNTRQAVKDAIGASLGQGFPKIEWVEVATAPAVRAAFAEGRFAALVLDGESVPEGGASVARSLHDISDQVPPVVLLTARPQDEWMARWAHVAATVMAPYDPFEIEAALQQVLR